MVSHDRKKQFPWIFPIFIDFIHFIPKIPVDFPILGHPQWISLWSSHPCRPVLFIQRNLQIKRRHQRPPGAPKRAAAGGGAAPGRKAGDGLRPVRSESGCLP